MEFSSYDQLLRQVDILKVENNNLRRELADNSNHLSQLENEASTMKEVLIHHLNNGRMDGECERTTTTTEHDVTDGIPDNRQAKSQNEDGDDEVSNHNPGSFQAQVQQLEKERSRILQDIEAEEKDKQLFHTCMERIKQQLFQLSHANGYSSTQADRTRRQQLEREADSLRETMQQKLGSRGEMHRREEARVHSICLIEKEIEKLYHLQDNSNKYVNSEKMDVESLNEKSMTDLCDDEQSRPSELDDTRFSSKMTTSATQTSDAFTSMTAVVTQAPSVASPMRPPEGDPSGLSSIYHGTWPMDKVLWHSGPSSVSGPGSTHSFHNHDTGSVASGKSNVFSINSRSNDHQFGTKVEMVYSLLSMLASHNKDDVSRKLLSMSSSVDSCVAMRQSGCMPLLVELLHGDDKEASEGSCGEGRRRPSKETRQRAGEALHNVVHSHPDDKRGRREARVLRLLEQIRDYCALLSDSEAENGSSSSEGSDDDDNGHQLKAAGAEKSTDKHPVPAMAMLMKLSFDEEHRHAMCQLGGLQATAELLQEDYETHGNLNDQHCITLRRYAGMALTNLTFGDGTNKALLCSLRSFMKALVAQLHSPSEDLRQVIASVLRNLSWRADQASKKTLREVGAVATLMRAAMEAKKESTLKSILSALWNLSAHCSMNKADICAVDGALAFLVCTLTYRSPSNTHSIVENGGGILRNISSHVAVREDYRDTLRQHNCLQILLLHLRSPSLTIVSNACGTLWNLSARCSEDQQALWDMGAVGMLRNLVHSKHKMIAMGSSAALKNLLAAKPGGLAANAERNSKSSAPSLLVRKQKALEAELDQNLAETCENLDSPKTSPTHHRCETASPKFGGASSLRHGYNHNHQHQVPISFGLTSPTPYQLHGRMYHSVGGQLPQPSKDNNVSRSESKDSILSTQSDSSHDRLRNLDILLRHRQKPAPCHDGVNDSTPQGVLESRIQYVMQEVTRQIALENEFIRSDCAPVKPTSSYLKPSCKLSAKTVLGEPVTESTPKRCPLSKNDDDEISRSTPSSADVKATSTMFDKYSNLTTMIENMNLEEDGDQPVDYSLKYSEGVNRNVNSNVSVTERIEPPLEINQKQNNVDWQASKKSHPEPVIYGDYAETDLDGPDQPTNFSLRYTEDTDTTDTFRAPDPQEGSPYFGHEYGAKGPSFHDDTIMTYCTEDTPLNFSTATSLSDLREFKDTPASIEEEEEDEEEEHGESGRRQNEATSKEQIIVEAVHGHEETIDKLNIVQEAADIAEDMPDKVITYCVEGTPGCYSRMSPLSSIVSNDVSETLEKNSVEITDDQSFEVTETEKSDVTEDLYTDKTKMTKTEAPLDTRCNQPHEGKTVTFGDDQHYAEETPLMFSRCSSLGSLSSFDQHSIHDDHSSVISDFSRRASEVVSPSDLPDSPGQTLPPSPRSRHAPVSFFGRVPRDVSAQSKIAKPCPTRRSTIAVVVEPNVKKSVFEDASKVYLDEGTPVDLSTTNSVTSHGIRAGKGRVENADDSFDVAEPSSHALQSFERLNSAIDDDKDAVKTVIKVELKINEENVEKSLTILADLSEDEDSDDNEEDILAACINSAMPNNSRDNKQKHNNTKLCSKINILSGAGAMRSRGGSSIPVKASNLKLGSLPTKVPQSTAASCVNTAVNFRSNNVDGNAKNGTIDCGSSDTSSVFDDDPDRILAQCIRSGMPKSSNDLSKHAGNLLVDRQGDGSSGSSDKENYDKVHFSHMYLRTRAAASSFSATNREAVDDDITVFAVEGTPINFSNATSLSNLTVDSSNADGDCKPLAAAPDKCKEGDFWAAAKFYPVSESNVFCGAAGLPRPTANTRHCNVSNSKLDDVALPRYAEESTPSCLSHGSSLSALSEANTDASGRDGSDYRRPFLVEDTPVCFSQNSSLSSLSVESLLVEPSPSEQALLEECISSGMPKGHSPSEDYPGDATHGGKSRRSKLPCPTLTAKERRREVVKMDCIDEKPKENVVGFCQSESGTKNVEGTAVVAEDHTGTAAAAIAGGTAEDIENDASNKCTTTTSEMLDVGDGRIPVRSRIEDPLELGGALLVLLEATKVSLDVQKVGKAIPESMEQSLVSASSDLLDNVNPPSLMGDLSSSVVSSNVVSSNVVSSSNTSDSHVRKDSVDSKGVPVARPRLTLAQRPKNVSELLMKALADGAVAVKQTSVCESPETVSMLDNVKPPSVMDDVDLTSSMYSVCSIVSEVADSKSEGLLSVDSSDAVFKCLKPVVAMAEMYARDIAKSEYHHARGYSASEIENVNPPSTFLEITANTYNDFTEVANTDTLENNDTDVEDDLPDDDPVPWKIEEDRVFSEEDNELRAATHATENRTVERRRPSKKTRNELRHYNHDAVNADVVDAEAQQQINEEELDITPEEVIVLQEDANLVLSTLKEIQLQDCFEDCPFEDIECETLSLVSNESDSSYSTSTEVRDQWASSPKQSRCGRPRIVKPMERAVSSYPVEDEVQQTQKAVPKGIRGRRKALYSRRQVSASSSAAAAPPPPPRIKDISSVKPTRTSALRATQSQQKVASGCGPFVNSKRIGVRGGTFVRSNSNGEVTKQVRHVNVVSYQADQEEEEEDNSESRPGPPIKQGTFTKDKPTLDSPPKISPSKTRIPALNTAVVREHSSRKPMEDRPPRGAVVRPTSRARLMASKSVDDGSGSGAKKPQEKISGRGRGGGEGGEEEESTKSWSSPPQANRFLNRRGQSSSPVQRSLSNSTVSSPRSIPSSINGIRNSPSTHSLGSNGGDGNNKRPQKGKVATLIDNLATTTKRSSSNGSLCSNTSSSTSNSRLSGVSARKEAQSKVASLWKSVNRSSSSATVTKPETKMMNTSKPVKKSSVLIATPKEGLSRSSTYEKLPTVENLNTACENEAEAEDKEKAKTEENGIKTSAGFLKKGTRVLAEARLQEWLARKARLAAKKNDEPEVIVASVTSSNNVVAAAIVTPFNYTPNSGHHQQQQEVHGPQRPHRSLIPTPHQVSPYARQQPREAYDDTDGNGGAGGDGGPVKRRQNGKQPCLISTV